METRSFILPGGNIPHLLAGAASTAVLNIQIKIPAVLLIFSSWLEAAYTQLSWRKVIGINCPNA